jgi:hypothetical protein
VQAAADEVSQTVGNDAGVAAARLELCKDGEARGCVGIEDCTRESLDTVGAWEAEKLFDVSRRERIDPRREELVEH